MTDRTHELCNFEIDVLKMMDGQEQDSVTGWGAALSAAIEALHRGCYIERQMIGGSVTYALTEKGKKVVQ